MATNGSRGDERVVIGAGWLLFAKQKHCPNGGFDEPRVVELTMWIYPHTHWNLADVDDLVIVHFVLSNKTKNI